MYSNVQNLDRTQNQNKLNFAVTLYSEFTRPICLSVCFQVDRSDLFLLFSQQRRCNKEFIAVTKAIGQLVNKIAHSNKSNSTIG